MWEIRKTENKNVIVQRGEIVEVPHNVPKVKRSEINGKKVENFAKNSGNSSKVIKSSNNKGDKTSENVNNVENNEQSSNDIDSSNVENTPDNVETGTGVVPDAKDDAPDNSSS